MNDPTDRQTRPHFKTVMREGEAPGEPGFSASSARQEPRPPRLEAASGCALLGCLLLIGPAWAASLEVPDAVLAAQQQRIDVIQRACHSTVAIFPGNSASGGGSGVVITADGYALTNFHVAQPCGKLPAAADWTMASSTTRSLSAWIPRATWH